MVQKFKEWSERLADAYVNSILEVSYWTFSHDIRDDFSVLLLKWKEDTNGKGCSFFGWKKKWKYRNIY